MTNTDLRGLPLYDDTAQVVGLGDNVTREYLQHTTRDFLADLATLSSPRPLVSSSTNVTIEHTLAGMK